MGKKNGKRRFGRMRSNQSLYAELGGIVTTYLAGL
jgi:hypothetical protein